MQRIDILPTISPAAAKILLAISWYDQPINSAAQLSHLTGQSKRTCQVALRELRQRRVFHYLKTFAQNPSNPAQPAAPGAAGCAPTNVAAQPAARGAAGCAPLTPPAQPAARSAFGCAPLTPTAQPAAPSAAGCAHTHTNPRPAQPAAHPLSLAQFDALKAELEALIQLENQPT